jgi:hypothetical protein
MSGGKKGEKKWRKEGERRGEVKGKKEGKNIERTRRGKDKKKNIVKGNLDILRHQFNR